MDATCRLMYAVQCSVYVLCVVTGHSRSDAHPSGRQPYYPLPAARRSRPTGRRPQSSSGRALRRRQEAQDRRADGRCAAAHAGKARAPRAAVIRRHLASVLGILRNILHGLDCSRIVHVTLTMAIRYSVALMSGAHPRGPATNNTRPPSGAGRGVDAPPTRTRTATVTRGGACAQRAGDVCDVSTRSRVAS